MASIDENDFTRLSGAEPPGFKLQIQAIKNLVHFHVTTHPAVMVSFSGPEDINALKRRLREIHEDSHR